MLSTELVVVVSCKVKNAVVKHQGAVAVLGSNAWDSLHECSSSLRIFLCCVSIIAKRDPFFYRGGTKLFIHCFKWGEMKGSAKSERVMQGWNCFFAVQCCALQVHTHRLFQKRYTDPFISPI